MHSFYESKALLLKALLSTFHISQVILPLTLALPNFFTKSEKWLRYYHPSETRVLSYVLLLKMIYIVMASTLNTLSRKQTQVRASSRVDGVRMIHSQSGSTRSIQNPNDFPKQLLFVNISDSAQHHADAFIHHCWTNFGGTIDYIMDSSLTSTSPHTYQH